MKSAFYYFVSLCLLLLLILVASCRPVPTSEIDPVSPPTDRYYNAYVQTDKASRLGFALIDTSRQEAAIAFGTKDASGSLIAIKNIVYRPTKNSEFICNAILTTDNLLDEVEIVTNDGIKALQFSDYDLAAGKVYVQLLNKTTNTYIGTKQQLTLEASTLAAIKEMQKLGLKMNAGGRLAYDSELCLTRANFVRLTLGYTYCAVSLSLTVGAFATGIGIPVAVWVGLASTVWSCTTFLHDVREFIEGKCEGPPRGKEVTGDCLIGGTEYILSRKPGQLADCVTEIVDHFLGPEDPAKPKPTPNTPTEADSLAKKPAHGFSTGDPHLTTADGLPYDFQGYGEFIAAKSTVDNFEIQVRQEDVAKTIFATLNTAVAIQTGSDIICATANPDKLFINGQPQDLTFDKLSLKEGAMISRLTGDYGVSLYITTKNKDVVIIRYHGHALLDYGMYLNANRKGKLIGLMGNFDGKSYNDLQTRSGVPVKNTFLSLYPGFADSWRLTSSDAKLLYYPPGKTTNDYTKRDFPAKRPDNTQAAIEQAESICRTAGITTEPSLSNCIYDYLAIKEQWVVNSSVWAQKVQNTALREFSIKDFSATSIPIMGYTYSINGKELRLYGTVNNPEVSYAIVNQSFDVGNGFEAILDFSLSGQYQSSPIGLNLFTGSEFVYNYNNDFQYKSGSGLYFELSPGNGFTSNLDMPDKTYDVFRKYEAAFDGKQHKLKIVLKNLSPKGFQVDYYLDDMSTPIQHAENSNVASLYSYFTIISKHANALRFISVESRLNHGSKLDQINLQGWTFRPL